MGLKPWTSAKKGMHLGLVSTEATTHAAGIGPIGPGLTLQPTGGRGECDSIIQILQGLHDKVC